MPVTRTYRCDDCAWTWNHFHARNDEPYPECPKCEESKAQWVPQSFAITGVKSKAVDMAQQIMEEDFGFTDARDNLREGDTVVKGPAPIQTAEAEQLTQMMVEQAREMGNEVDPNVAQGVKEFWQHPGQTPPALAQKMMEAQASAPVARATGDDPIGNLHKSAEKAFGKLPEGAPAAAAMNLQVLSRADPSKLA